MVEQQQLQMYYVLLMTINVTLALVVMLASCLCCKRRPPKNEFLGVEGMVKLKNPDEIIVTTVGHSESQVDLNISTVSNGDSEKRASTAAHRSLPDIPIADATGDNGSEFYETVADKQLVDAQNNKDNPISSLQKQHSVSQHSSISQADDLSSPYSRVKNSAHGYAKVRGTEEHPYAQLNAPTTSAAAATANSSQEMHESSNRNSLTNGSIHNISETSAQAEIPAASAIAGMISASQDLPYMTPPITNQHFSGDSQDSSKGYTSISVREPLANIMSQQPVKVNARSVPISQDVNDSHYATVSDDSDETYAAIDDPNGRHAIHGPAVDIYTSGSETYAQIQPMQANSIVVSVEINNTDVPPVPNSALEVVSLNSIIKEPSVSPVLALATHHPHPTRSSIEHTPPLLPPVDSLRAQMHSRQASSSSNNSSSMGMLGSPKPEKRQANSPLPPTPKASVVQAAQHQLHLTSGSTSTSGRNSVISVIELSGETASNAESSPQKKSLSPSKDIEGMYAKVMKKNKLSRHTSSSQNNSPILTRKQYDTQILGVSPLDSAAAELMEGHKANPITEKTRTRSNSYNAKDHGYETIPADGMRTTSGLENRKSDCYTNILQKERQLEGVSHTSPTIVVAATELSYRNEKLYETIAARIANDPGYETLLKPPHAGVAESAQKTSDYDPNYEMLQGALQDSAGLSDDGYAKVLEKKFRAVDEDSTDGYSKVKGEENEDGAVGGYSTIGGAVGADANHNYASILETKGKTVDDNISDHYARINETNTLSPNLAPLSALSSPTTTVDDILSPRFNELPVRSPSSANSSLLNTSSVASSTVTSTSTMSSHQTASSSQYESLTGSETDPNYESVCYLQTENPYQRLPHDYSDTHLSSPVTPEERSSAMTPTTAQQAAGTTVPRTQSKPKVGTETEVVVDDYFQV